jgi:hypothetical protein
MPAVRLAGRTVASTIKYVGLQLEKTGPSEPPMMTSPQKLCLAKPSFMVELDSAFIFAANGSLSHTFGNSIKKPTMIISPPEKSVQNHGGTAIKIVSTFSARVKMKTEIPSEVVTVSALLILRSPEIDPPTMIGKRGRTHGDKTVRTPASRAIRKSAI